MYRYGLGPFQPQCLQILNHRWWLITVICLYIIFAGMLMTGFSAVTVTSLEKRYELRSTETGALPSAGEIASAIIGILASYFAGRHHKGRYLSVGAIVLALGALMYSLPHFVTDPYTVVSSSTNYSDLCLETQSTPSNLCDKEFHHGGQSNIRYFFYMFLVAQLLMGAGNNLIWNVGTAYIDENVHPVSSPLYIAVTYTVSVVGPAAGYILGGIFLNRYINWPEAPPPGLTPYDARWIGAWWLCFIVSAASLGFIAVPLFGFPRKLPGYEKHKRLREEMANSNGHRDYGINLKDFIKASQELFRNKAFVFLTCAGILEYLATIGISWFFPKILETQFRLPSYVASFTVGLITVPGGCVGMILGGMLVRIFRMNGRKAAKLACILGFVDCALSAVFLLGCDSLPFAGVNAPYTSHSLTSFNEVNLTAICNSGCMCNKVEYNAICGSDGKTYYSPCHAGCKTSYFDAENLTYAYRNCSCIPKASDTYSNYDAIQGSCTSNCQEFKPFVIGISIAIVAVMSKTVPSTEALLRSVPENQRVYALGVSSAMIRLAGNLPGPILIGAFIDYSCLLWGNECDSSSTCWFYDSRKMGMYLYISLIMIKLLSTFLFILSWRYYRKDQGLSSTGSTHLLDFSHKSEDITRGKDAI
ncbi:uncharacterized protein TRIADDRAFT_33605 [Trichoplax adhaerens]|uniref:Solute carrier organic anion transporter family member n=1 Tax=Trichoplax adhaerens TaxID=10228 RepID=B3SCW7_TRIAD|nr:hypothetical protein TRIADDRAFT_33605 [Trichoplax adhaerens]EDV19391.1 hypothetical protein TRIADDRAFT_33605 [Trichoplax adhaerens]|eukprot:XP_002118080.1 hypothetical protein TRIADDRAFT_33605 [Trichoplax adhaerens]